MSLRDGRDRLVLISESAMIRAPSSLGYGQAGLSVTALSPAVETIEIISNRARLVSTQDEEPGPELITTRQVKAARALLGWSQADLARAADVSEPTLARLEAEDGKLGGRRRTNDKLRSALERAGIEFISEFDGGIGVRFRKPSASD
ncbi:helix-turn-helix domain-containing protein [Ancylobacter tetraedralis]|uniref:helix-turn-helix domain-containing protein n=1 Tax=Ancylobacter tetraedralis TaxID=217068 RepID=UPI0031B5C3AB